MPQVEIVVGDRSFEVACQPGEESFLRAAAAILDGEASALSSQIGRMPEARMLLMAGLMLADKASGLEERLRETESRLAEAEARGTRVERVEVPVEVLVEVPVEVPVEVRVEVPVMTDDMTRIVAEMVEEAEALARAVVAVSPQRESVGA